MDRTLIALLPALALGTLAACGSTPVAGPDSSRQAVATTPRAAPAMPAATTGPASQSAVATVALPDHLNPNSNLAAARSVYFEFDNTVLAGEYLPLIERHGRYLAAHPQLAVRIEGHTDERGSAEYNLALGQQRALTVVRALKTQGVRDSQLEAVSWGEEKPRAAGHDESQWAQNRRADMQYPQQQPRR